MNGDSEKWERVSIELPPGWHDVLVKLAGLSGLKLKYLYTLAVDRLLADSDIHMVIEDAWTTERQAKSDLARVARSYTVADMEERFREEIKKNEDSAARSRKKKALGK